MSAHVDRHRELTSDPPAESHARTRRGAAAECSVAGAALILSVLLPPPDTTGRILHLPSICPFYLITGLPCPGCGLTRAFVLISHGEWRQSLAFHPVGWLAYAAFLLMCIDGLPMLIGVRDAPLLPRAVKSRILWGCAAVTLAVGLLRLASEIFGGVHRAF